jgi:hypothetical protein
MSYLSKIPALFLFLISMFILQACSEQGGSDSSKQSPADAGKQLGERMCNCLGDFSNLDTRSLLKGRMDSCDASIANDWATNERGLQQDSMGWQAFQDAYTLATKTKMDAFQQQMQQYAAQLAKEIEDGLQRGYWIKEGDSKAEYVCSFADGQVKFVNASGKTNYELKADTICFKDRSETKAVASFDRNGRLILTQCGSNKKSVFGKATDQDKLVGQWSVQRGLSVAIYANGSCTVSQGGVSRTAGYSLRGGALEIDGPPAFVISLSNPDRFGWGQANFNRVKGSHPKDLEVLF